MLLTDLEMGSYPDYLGGGRYVITRVTIGMGGKQKRDNQKDSNMEKIRPAIAGFEDGSGQ